MELLQPSLNEVRDRESLLLRQREEWKSLGLIIAGLVFGALLLLVIRMIHSRQQTLESLRILERQRAFVRTKSLTDAVYRDDALNHWMRGLNPIVRVRFAKWPAKEADQDEILAELKKLPSLKVLRIEHRDFSSHNCQELAKLTQLDSLSLSRTSIKDDDLHWLNSFKKLTWIMLDETAVTDLTAKRLALFPRMEMISVEQTSISDDGLKQLAAIPGLQRLYYSPDRIRPETIEEIRKTHPALRVIPGRITSPPKHSVTTES